MKTKPGLSDEQYEGYLLGYAFSYLESYTENANLKNITKAIRYLEELLEFSDESEPEIPVKKVGEGGNIPFTPPLTLEKQRASYQGLPNTADGVQEPRSSHSFTYEGGTSKLDLYRCKKCKARFEIPLGSIPGMYHACTLESQK